MKVRLLSYSAHQGAAFYELNKKFFYTEYPYSEEFVSETKYDYVPIISPDFIEAGQSFNNLEDLQDFLNREYLVDKKENEKLKATQKLLKDVRLEKKSKEKSGSFHLETNVKQHNNIIGGVGMKKEFMDLINKNFNNNRQLGLIQVSVEDEFLDGKTVTVRGNKMTYYGSSNYLALATDTRIKEAAIDAVNRFGSHFPYSRNFIQMGMYEEVEDTLEEVFGKPVLLAPTVSLGHFTTIPLLVSEKDACIADQQVHNSVRNALQLAKGSGAYVETLPHNRIDLLEARILSLQNQCDRIWYFVDGIYSMYGDAAPFEQIDKLMLKYPALHLYVDDSQGVSWDGKHGRGVALSRLSNHPRMVVAISLSKGFGGGGALIFNNDDEKNAVKNCGSSFIFSSPLQPAVLGAIKAAAIIHLSSEIDTLQNDLYERMLFFVERSRQFGLPLISNELTPIFYIGLGKPEIGIKLSDILYKEGIMFNLMQFPAVSVKNTGVRIALTNHHSIQDINHLLEAIAHYLPKIAAENNYTYEDIYSAFGLKQPDKSSDYVERKKWA